MPTFLIDSLKKTCVRYKFSDTLLAGTAWVFESYSASVWFKLGCYIKRSFDIFLQYLVPIVCFTTLLRTIILRKTGRNLWLSFSCTWTHRYGSVQHDVAGANLPCNPHVLVCVSYDTFINLALDTTKLTRASDERLEWRRINKLINQASIQYKIY